MSISKHAAAALGLSLILSGMAAPAAFAQGASAASPFRPWINGVREELQMQVQKYDADTFIIRQSVRTNPEAPFLFLFLGPKRALLIDTGAGGLKVRPTIDKVIADWASSKGVAQPPLVVAHSHAHDDHTAGDPEFADRPNTVVVGHSPKEVATFFHVQNWPDDIATLDLGGREIDIIPTPGHEPAEISVFDRQTRLLLTGDALYPGRLYVERAQFDAYRRSVDRIVDYTKNLHVSWILGNHIEMSNTPGDNYAIGAPTHPNEHVLQLPYSALLDLQKLVDPMTMPRLEVQKDFIFYPIF